MAGQQFEYAFDTIGNRTSTQAGGDQNGANLRSATYAANNLNQYTNRTVPGYVDIMGLGFATNTVTVNGQTRLPQGRVFPAAVERGQRQLPGVAVGHERGRAERRPPSTGNLFVPKTPELFGYDADGNLTNDGRWSYTWDAENRLYRMTNNTAVGPQQLLTFDYDWQGRRIQKQVWPANGVG